MSDFISHLLDRHLGIGAQVLPCPKARFAAHDPFMIPTWLPAESFSELTEEAFNKDFPGEHPSEKSISLNDFLAFGSQVRDQPGAVVEADKEKNQVRNTVSAIQIQTAAMNKNEVMPLEPEPSRNRSPEFIRSQEFKKKGGEVGRDGQDGLPPALAQENLIEPSLKFKSKIIVEDIVSNLKQINLVKKQDNLLSKLLILRNRVSKDSGYNPIPPHMSIKGEPSVSQDRITSSLGQEVELIDPQPAGKVSSHFDLDAENVLTTPSPLAGKVQDFYRRLMSNDLISRSEPVVNVTIGRVEVRAVQSPILRESPKQEKPSGVMSLDEYLSRSKSGGNR